MPSTKCDLLRQSENSIPFLKKHSAIFKCSTNENCAQILHMCIIIRYIQHTRMPSCCFRSTRNCSKQTHTSFSPLVLTPFILDVDKGQNLILSERHLFRCSWEANYNFQQCVAVLIQNSLYDINIIMRGKKIQNCFLLGWCFSLFHEF